MPTTIDVCRRMQEEVFGNRRLELIEELATDDIVVHAAPPGSPPGWETVRQSVEWIHSGLDDVSYELEDAFATDDRVTIRCTMRGTHAREWMGHAATGRAFAVQHIHVFRIRDGRIAEHWAGRDDLGMLRQLGLT